MTEERFEGIKFGEDVRTVIVKLPTPKLEAEANMYSSQIFARLIKKTDDDGNPAFLLRSQLDDYLQKIGLYTNEDILQISKIHDEIKQKESVLEKGGIKKSDGKKIALDIRRLRYNLIILLTKRHEYDKNTVEYYAENGRFNYLVSKCLFFDSGEQIFNSVEDYESDTTMKGVLDEPIRRLATLTSTYDQDFEHKLIENKFLKKFGYCNDDYELVNSEGKRVNENGELVDDNGNKIEEENKDRVVGEFLDDES